MTEEGHYPLWRVIGYEDGADTAYEEIKVCAACVPKHSHFRSREDVPDWPAHLSAAESTTSLPNRPTEG